MGIETRHERDRPTDGPNQGCYYRMAGLSILGFGRSVATPKKLQAGTDQFELTAHADLRSNGPACSFAAGIWMDSCLEFSVLIDSAPALHTYIHALTWPTSQPMAAGLNPSSLTHAHMAHTIGRVDFGGPGRATGAGRACEPFLFIRDLGKGKRVSRSNPQQNERAGRVNAADRMRPLLDMDDVLGPAAAAEAVAASAVVAAGADPDLLVSSPRTHTIYMGMDLPAQTHIHTPRSRIPRHHRR